MTVLSFLQAETGEDNQVGKLVDILNGRPHGVDQLIYALRVSEQRYVATTYLPVPAHLDDTWSDVEDPDEDEGKFRNYSFNTCLDPLWRYIY